MRLKAVLGAVAIAAVASLAAGCSAGQPAGGRQAPGAAAAAAARYQVTNTMRTIYDRWLYGTGIGYATSLNGDFAACSSSQFSYHGEMELHPLGTVSGAAFTHRITRALRSHGWRVYPQKFIEAAPPARVYSYGVTQGMTGGLMYVVAGQPGHALQARFEFQSQCFKLSGQAPGSPGRLPLPHTADQPRQTGRAGTL